MSDNFYRDNDDLRFHIENTVNWDRLFNVLEHGAPASERAASYKEATELYEDILDEFGKFSAREVAPHARKIDQQKVSMADGVVEEGEEFAGIFKKLKAMSVYGLPVPRELGGLNAPALVYLACAEMMARGDVSCMTHFGFHTGVAMSLLMYAMRDDRTVVKNGRVVETPYDAVIAEILTGDAWGCMVLTEPGAGSDLAVIRTTAVPQEGGDERDYILNGEKIFITSGHGQYQLVLARTEDPAERPGLKGLSLFLCKQRHEVDGEWVDNVRIGKVEHKIGHNGSPTTSLIYENSHGVLIGKLGEGFELMLVLMNFARLAVGFEGLGIMDAAWRLAKEYAAERVTMGKSIDRHEMIADFLEDMELQVVGVRALLFHAAELSETSQRMEQILKFDPPKDEEHAKLKSKVRKMKLRTRKLTPLCKYAGSEQAVRLARLSMQILGGAGYTQEWLAEKMLRDALVLPIYEGTSQIQSLMAFKDQMMAGLKEPQRFITKVARARINAITHKDPMQRGLSKLYTYKFSALQTILMRIAKNKLRKTYDLPIGEWQDALFAEWDPKLDFAPGLLHAERLTKILIDVEIARVLVDEAERFPERRKYAERWLGRADLRCRAVLAEIEEHGDALLADLAELAQKAASEKATSVQPAKVQTAAAAPSKPAASPPEAPAANPAPTRKKASKKKASKKKASKKKAAPKTGAGSPHAVA